MRNRRSTTFGQPYEALGEIKPVAKNQSPPTAAGAQLPEKIAGMLPQIDFQKILKEHGIYLGLGFLVGKMAGAKNLLLVAGIGAVLYFMGKGGVGLPQPVPPEGPQPVPPQE